MMILSRVCAEFHDPEGNVLFAVTPSTRNTFVTAPETIRQDPLFRMLVSDGSLEAAVTEERKRILEQDPAAGHDASGKTIPAAPADEPEESEPPAKRTAKPAPKPSTPETKK